MKKEITRTAGVVAFSEDCSQVLLVRHLETARQPTGAYNLPGGRIDAGETEMQGALREFYEETGFIADPEDVIRLPKVWYADLVMKDGIFPFEFHAFVAKEYHGELTSDNETVPEWVSLTHLDDIALVGDSKEIIGEALRTLSTDET